ncbi:Kidins220, partial [Symbiodinium sp. KB8]
MFKAKTAAASGGYDVSVQRPSSHSETAVQAKTATFRAHLGTAASALDDDVSESGQAALMLAALNGHADIVKELLAKGANKDIRNTFGRSLGWLCTTALMYAARNGHADIVKELLAKGETALMLAALNGYPDIVKELLAKGADKAAAGRKAQQRGACDSH